MKASELVAEVQKAEADIMREIGEVVQARINELSTTTGLDIGGMGISFIDVTQVSSPERKYAIGAVNIDHSLPAKVSR